MLLAKLLVFNNHNYLYTKTVDVYHKNNAVINAVINNSIIYVYLTSNLPVRTSIFNLIIKKLIILNIGNIKIVYLFIKSPDLRIPDKIKLM